MLLTVDDGDERLRMVEGDESRMNRFTPEENSLINQTADHSEINLRTLMQMDDDIDHQLQTHLPSERVN